MHSVFEGTSAKQQKLEQAERLLELAKRREYIASRIDRAVLLRLTWPSGESADQYLASLGLSDII